MKTVTKKFYLIYNFKDDDLKIRKTKPNGKKYPYSTVTKFKVNYKVPEISPDELDIDLEISKTELGAITTQLVKHHESHKTVRMFKGQEAINLARKLDLKYPHVSHIAIRKDRGVVTNKYGPPTKYLEDRDIYRLVGTDYLSESEGEELFELFDKEPEENDD